MVASTLVGSGTKILTTETLEPILTHACRYLARAEEDALDLLWREAPAQPVRGSHTVGGVRPQVRHGPVRLLLAQQEAAQQRHLRYWPPCFPYYLL